MSRLIICGGGLAGALAAIAVAIRRPDIELLLVEQGASFGGNHIWSFFDSDVPDGCGWLVDRVERHRWPDHEVRFPKRSRRIALGYNSIRSSALDRAVRTALEPAQYRLGQRVAELGPRYIILGGECLKADCVIDARGPSNVSGVELGWQKFLGRVYRFEGGHGIERPMIMDARVEQIDGFRFLYFLPLGPSELLIEDTIYSASPLLDRAALGDRLGQAATAIDGGGTILSEEHGILPVVVDGTLDDWWPSGDAMPKLGLAGGFFHPTTGYSLPDALGNAVLLAGQHDLAAPAIRDLLRARAERLWHERHFFQLLNRMLFWAADPGERYRVLQHFYRLPPALIARFYSARLTPFDKLRILSGRPPVGIARAFSALRRRAA